MLAGLAIGLPGWPVHAMPPDRWAEMAANLATASPDPVAAKLALFYRLLAPGPGTANLAEIERFLAANPDWPLRATLLKRREDALLSETDDQAVARACDAQPPRFPGALSRCGSAFAAIGRVADAAMAVRRAWLALPADPKQESVFLAAHSGILTNDDFQRRFDHLAWADPDAARRDLPRLTKLQQRVAEARIALQADALDAAKKLAALPPSGDLGLWFEKARWLRRQGKFVDAVAVWEGLAASPVPADAETAFAAERALMARELLKLGDAEDAFRLAAGIDAPKHSEISADAEFLSGWIALQKLKAPDLADSHFRKLLSLSKAVIVQGRAHYWLGRTRNTQGDAPGAAREYSLAAALPTTYYGQLAALALGESEQALAQRIIANSAPVWDHGMALRFAHSELTRAAVLLIAWGEPRRARVFLNQLEETAETPLEKSLAARLALGFGMPDEAVTLARLAGRAGVALAQAGWPMPFLPPVGTVEPALALGVARQESNFDPDAASPVGARGLMQLMPGTAKLIAQQIKLQADEPALLTNPELNVRLGSVYLRQLTSRFRGALPLAIAAYNAGPGRVTGWLAANGDPRGEGAAEASRMIDWIEMIPFNETRNYVQRVVENMVIYRALRGTDAPHPVSGVGS